MIPVKYPSRRSFRLRDYDYRGPGVYFFTICVQDHLRILGKIINGTVALSSAERLVQKCWFGLPQHFPSVQLDQFVVMPNHVHGIMILLERSNARAGLRPAPTTGINRGPSLANLVGALKSFSARQINKARGTSGTIVWQRNYFERIVRSGDELSTIQRYINENPARWLRNGENSSALADPDPFSWKR